MEPAPGKIGKYQIVRELGRGATSRVYLARDTFANREVAIKAVSKDPKADRFTRHRFERIFLNEASLAGRLSHPHIIEIYDADVEDDLGYIVMEFVDGHTLEAHSEVDTLMPVQQVVELAFKCGLALDFANRRGIIHRDIKPANILMGRNGDIKLTDFGIALRHDADVTQLEGVGSPMYMSPEQIRDQPLNHQTDIYSLGVVMYRLLTGKTPFVASNNTSLMYQIANMDATPPVVHRPDLHPELDRIVRKATARDLSLRYQTWDELARDLSGMSKDLALPTDSITDTEKFSAIKEVRFFREFADLEAWEMVRIAAFRRVAPGETLVREGETCDSFFLIVGGEARVSKGGRSVSVLGDGDCFGEIPYFEDRGVRTSSVLAITPMTIIEVNATALRQSSDACQKQFNRAFLRILLDRIERLSRANIQLVESRNKGAC
jgi:eukaryotic-like serine/threonine-protein kinase